MAWNEIKVWLAPPGSQIALENSHDAKLPGGEPVSIVTVHPDDTVRSEPLQTGLAWLTSKGFRLVRTNGRNHEMRFEDASVLLIGDPESNSIKEVGFNLHVGLDVRSRIAVWRNLLSEFSKALGFKLVDPEHGLVEATDFERLVQRSFAWECFLEREKNLGSKL